MNILNSGNGNLISSIPLELIYQITSYLSYRDILNLCQTYSYLNYLLCQSDYIYGSHPSGGLANSFLS